MAIILGENMIDTQCSKIGKKCNFKSTKTHFLQFQKWQKINFCTRKKFKIAFLVVLNFFLVKKIDFFAIFEIAKMCFCTFEIALFSNFRALCAKDLFKVDLFYIYKIYRPFWPSQSEKKCAIWESHIDCLSKAKFNIFI